MARERPDLEPYVGRQLTVIAWLWARTVKSPNPAFSQVEVPLVSSFVLSSKANKEAYVEPLIENDGYRFTVKMGKPKDAEAVKNGTRAGKAQDFLCLMSGVPVPRTYIREQGKADRLGARLMAIVAEGDRGRVYLPPSEADEAIARSAAETAIVAEAKATFLSGSTPTRAMITGGVCSAYGLSTWGHLFTPRQLVALTTFSDLVQEARDGIIADARAAGMADDGRGLDQGGGGATAYGDATAVYMALAMDKASDYNSSLVAWSPTRDQAKTTFGRQALPMIWDYSEVNPFAGAAGDLSVSIDGISRTARAFPACSDGTVQQQDAQSQSVSQSKIVSTDPPYYDNIGYADLSDFFYVWLRRSLRPVFPDLFATMTVPKTEELVATPYRHGGQQQAERFFMDGMSRAIHNLAEQAHQAFPVTIYYAFKQSETRDAGTTSTGWVTFLEAVIRAGFAITGTWPMRTERSARSIGIGTNALASSIILVCRRREPEAASISRRDFQRELREQMPEALETMIGGKTGQSPIASVDLAQAAIGPGMAIYSKYAAVLNFHA